MINTDRLGKRFQRLVEIDSLSRCEKDVADLIEKILTDMGATVTFDNAKEKVNGNCSNLIVKFKGTINKAPIFLSGHMDTVGPGEGIKVRFENGIFKSEGSTVLGADDKSAIAIILEVMDVILENRIDYPPVELIFTVCEEIGLLGAKHLDYAMIESEFGYILDSTNAEGIVTRAPGANNINIKIHGRAAHAGAAPENGISAIAIASKAISRLSLGRIDDVTTCNLGTISGGVATNIVPEFVEIKGEARSHDDQKLKIVTDDIVNAFQEAVKAFENGSGLPKADIEVKKDFSGTKIAEDHKTILLAKKAAKNIGINFESKTIGGGADANIFFEKGIVAGVLGTGMKDVHTVNESIALKDMENAARLVLEILRLYASGTP